MNHAIGFWQLHVTRNLWTHSLMRNMSFEMHGHANFALKWSKCNAKLCNIHDILSFFVIFLCVLVFFCEKHKLTIFLLKDVITHATSFYLLQIPSGTRSEYMIWFFSFFVENRLTIFFLKKCDNSCNLILSFANLFGNSPRVYVLFDLVTW